MLACTIYPVSIPLARPIPMGGVRISSREGFLLQVLDPLGRVGFGECLPLPHFHKESFKDCLNQWNQLKLKFQHFEINTDSFDLRKPFLGMLPSLDPSLDLYPTLEFAIEQALLTLYLGCRPRVARQVFENHQQNLNNRESFGISVSAVLIPDEKTFEQSQEIAKRILQGRFRALKIKVGRFSIEKEIYLIRELAETLGKSIELRLDGNCQFTPEAFQDFAHRLIEEISAGHIASGQIAYIEEPLALNPTSLSYTSPNDSSSHDSSSHGHSSNWASAIQEIYDTNPLPIALDESLPYFQKDFIQGGTLPRAVQAIVVKPTTLGGIHRTVQLMDACKGRGLKSILSSAFDSGWTIATLGFLAQLAPPETAMGFDTYRFLSKDLLKEPLRFSKGKLWLAWDFWVTEKPQPLT